MIKYNPVIKNGRFQVTDKMSGTVKVYSADEESTAKWKMMEFLGLIPLVKMVNGKPDFEAYKSDVKKAYDRLNVICVKETERMYD